MKKLPIISLALTTLLIGCSSSDNLTPTNPPETEPNLKTNLINISQQLPKTIVDEIDPQSQNGFDSFPTTEPPESSYHHKTNLTLFDATNDPHDIAIYFLLSNSSARIWQIRVKLDGQTLSAIDLDNDGDNTNDSQLGFIQTNDQSGLLDLALSSGNGILSFESSLNTALTTALTNSQPTENRLNLDFSQGTIEHAGGFINSSLWLSLQGKGFFITSAIDRPQDNLFTRIGNFRITANGQVINQFNENLKVFPVNPQGEVTSTSLTSTHALTISAEFNNNQLLRVEIAENGLVTGFYQNNSQVYLGKIALTYFINPQDLSTKDDSTSLVNTNDATQLTGEANTSPYGLVVANSINPANPNYPDYPYTLKINGEGYFLLKPDIQSGNFYVSKQSDYRTNNDSFVENKNHELLQYFQADNNQPVTENDYSLSDAVALQLPISSGAPLASNSINFGFNLDFNSATLNIQNFSSSNPLSFNDTTSLTLFDDLGENHPLNFYLIHQTDHQWGIYFTSKDDNNNLLPLNINGGLVGNNGQGYLQLNFNADGSFLSNTPATIQLLNLDFNNGSNPQTIELSMEANLINETNQPFAVNQLEQNGHSIGRLKNISIDHRGFVEADYSTEFKPTLGRLALVKFSDDNCLVAVENSDSLMISDNCQTTLGSPGDPDFGTIEFEQFIE